MTRLRPLASLAAALLVGACTPPQPRPSPVPGPVPPPPPPVAAPAEVSPPTQVWARRPGVPLRADTATTAEGTAVPVVATVPHVGMRLDVLQADTARLEVLQVRCGTCPGTPTGWVYRGEVALEPHAPAAARYLELADFVLAVREAALRRDVAALRPVMATDFVHSFEAPEGVLSAIEAWEGPRFNDLVFLPTLLDRGVVPVPGTAVWAAPPEFAAQPGYRDLRAGFRRGPDGWEWLFLVAAGS